MAQPPAPDPRALPRPFGLPGSFSAGGSPGLYPAPGREQQASAALPAGLQMAPCGCFFDPRIYHIEWAATSFLQPPVYKLGGGSRAPPGAFLLDTQRYPATGSQPDPFGPYWQLSGSPQYAAASAPPEDGPTAVPAALATPGARRAAPLLLALPGLGEPPLHTYSHIEGRLKPVAEPPPGPAPTEVTASRHRIARASSAGPGSQQPAELPDKVLLEDAMKLFDCSLAAELGQEELSGLLKLGERPGADGFFLCDEAARDIGSLWLPEELLSSDYSVPEILSAVLSMDYFYAVKAASEEPSWDAGPEPPPPPDSAGQQETEGNNSSGIGPGEQD